MSCLSCHDGTVAIDSIINMPGTGGYDVGQETAQNNQFLNGWDNPSGPDASTHMTLSQCIICHTYDPDSPLTAGADDFRVALIGTDLTNDHPIGIEYGSNAEFNPPTATRGTISFFDGNGNGRPDGDEIRMYDTGDGPEIECASCHDPHGVPSGGSGSLLEPTFLRTDNAGSKVCLTCHVI